MTYRLKNKTGWFFAALRCRPDNKRCTMASSKREGTVGWEGVPRKEQEDENQEERRTTPGL